MKQPRQVITAKNQSSTPKDKAAKTQHAVTPKDKTTKPQRATSPTLQDQPTSHTKLSFLAPLFSALIFSFFASLNLRTAMWFDESYSAYLIRGNFSQIWQMTAMDVHPPFYYFCLKLWSMLFGTSEFALRSMSVFFAGAGIILAFFLLRRWFGEKAAAISTFALSLAPILIRYSQEMRMYGLVFAIVVGATLALDIALKTRRKTTWLCYALLICLGMWTHYFTALAWLAHLAYIIHYFRKNGLQKSIFWAYPLAVALFLPWTPSFLNQVKQVQSGFWIPPVNLATPFSFISESLIFHSVEETQGWFVLLVLATVIATVVILAKTFAKPLAKPTQTAAKNFGFLLSLVFIPPVLLMLLSFPPFQPTYVTRYVTYSASLLWSIFGIALYFGQAHKERLLSAALAILLIISATIGIITVDTRDNTAHTRSIITAIHAIDQQPSPILTHVDAMDYYDLFFYETDQHPVFAIDIDYIWGSLEPIRAYHQNVIDDTSDFIAQQSHFWLILPKTAEDEATNSESTKNESTANNNTKTYSFKNFHTTNSISTNKFTATEYHRDK